MTDAEHIERLQTHHEWARCDLSASIAWALATIEAERREICDLGRRADELYAEREQARLQRELFRQRIEGLEAAGMTIWKEFCASEGLDLDGEHDCGLYAAPRSGRCTLCPVVAARKALDSEGGNKE